MFIKKITTGILFLVFLNGCGQHSALLGPMITAVSTGSSYQAGLSYGTNQLVEKATGKSAMGNIRQILELKDKDNEFERLVKKRIIETRKKMNLANQ